MSPTVFSSLSFLFFYLPLVLFVYYITPLRWRNGVLLVLNLVFYAWGEPVYILIMFASIAIDYIHGRLVSRYKTQGNDRKARLAVASSVVFNLLLLFFFKYWDFLAESLSAIGLPFMPILGLGLPIGISFYTFQTMSYTIDVYRGDANCQRNLVSFGTYVTLFPQLIAGPIIKYKDLDDQIDCRSHSVEKFSSGVTLFVIGLAKKVLIANNVGMLWDSYHAMAVGDLSVLGAWLGVLAFTFQIYFDFSGYSDMAIGLGRMLGFEFLKNFDYPYQSPSITEFWRRWHISLSTWFREYLYFPLGGNRVGKVRWYLNILLVWAATGLWHGASWNFLLWGLYFAALLILEKSFLMALLDKLPWVFRHIYTMFFVVVSWAIFAIDDLSQLGGYLFVMFGLGGVPAINGDFFYYLTGYLPLLLTAGIASTPLLAGAFRKLPDQVSRVILPFLLLGGLLLSTAYLVDSTYNPFLYFRF